MIEEHTETNTTYYIREPGGELIARVHPTDGIRYYHFDELGSTRLLTDANGAVTDRYAYDAYGSLLSHDRYSGSVNQPYQYVGQLGYYTHWMEPDFALLQLGVRFYDAQVGRFGQRDPAADGNDRYAYANGNPATGADPNGLWAIAANCSQQQTHDITKAMKAVWSIMSTCLSKSDVQKITDKLTIGQYQVSCGNAIGCNGSNFAYTDRTCKSTVICPEQWTGMVCGSFLYRYFDNPRLRYTLLHELLHAIGHNEAGATNLANKCFPDR